QIRDAPPPSYIQSLGLLGKLATTPAIFEPFRNAVTVNQIRSCMGKLFDIYAELERLAKREDRRIEEAQLPLLWVLTPTASPTLLDGFNFQPNLGTNWTEGVYFLGLYQKTALVAIHQLPRTEETLWLRILGKGRVQKQAIEELTALPEDHPLRESALELLYSLQANLEAKRELETEDRELIMALAPLYRQQMAAAIEQGRAEGIQQGRTEGIQQGRTEGIQQGRTEGIQQGRTEGQYSILENFLLVQFGELDPIFTAFFPIVSTFPATEFTLLLVQLSALSVDDNGRQQAKELLAQFVLKTRFGQLETSLTNLIPNLIALSPADLTLLLEQLPELSEAELLAKF
ncbi:MAG TPA: flagellar assembly protein H, partial [Cyanobacteria bacterium UBA11162]|nr:flagellar assembly protein H [Cyanobacteria bacterium UBA11162]